MGAHSQVRKITQEFVPDRTAVALEGIIPFDRLKDIPKFTFDFGVVEKGYGWLFPKGDHVNIGLYTYLSGSVKLSKAQLIEYATERLGVSEIDHICGFPIATGGEFYQPKAERVFLVGDAAGMSEALMGEGIHNAIKSGQAAATALIEARHKNSNALVEFQKSISDVKKDAYNCRKVATAFYKVLPLSFFVVGRYPAGAMVMNGFAAGLTVTEIKRKMMKLKITHKIEESESLAAYRKKMTTPNEMA
jgi:flavin-dependent dehydrogenase